MAGTVWAESAEERQQRLQRDRTFKKMKENPVGLGFGERDSFGPDNTYSSVEFINNKLYQ